MPKGRAEGKNLRHEAQLFAGLTSVSVHADGIVVVLDVDQMLAGGSLARPLLSPVTMSHVCECW
jgi:hypothetical protein